MTTRRRTPKVRSASRRAGRPARRAALTRSAELREVIRLQRLSGKTIRETRIPIATEPVSVFRTLP